MKKSFLNLFLCVFLTTAAFSQTEKSDDPFFKDFVSRSWNAESGLGGNTVTDIMQDCDGYMYFGTYGGLVRFDGDEFISINRLYDSKYDFLTARTIFQDKHSNIWIGSNDEGIVCIKDNGEIIKFTTENGLPNNSIRAFCEDKEGNIWVGTASGISCISPELHFVNIKGFETIPNDNHFIVVQIYCDSAGRIWIVTQTEHGLYCYTDGKFIVSELVKSVENPIVTAITQESSGAFWVGIAPYYVVKITSEDETLYNIGNGSQKGTQVKTILQDSAKNIWFGLDNGITVLHDGIFSYCDTDSILVDDSINEIIEDREKNIWLAMDRGGIQKLSFGKFQTTNIPSTINAIAQDKFRDVVWLAADKGLYCYKNNHFLENKITEYCKNTRIRHVSVTEDGAVLVCCYEKFGQLKFNLDGSVEQWTKATGIAGDKIRVAEQMKNGDLYIGTTTGLSVVSAENKEITNIIKADILDNDFIMCLYEDDDGSVWFGTDGGGVYILKDGKIIKKYTKDMGLTGNVIFKISQVRDGEIWICTGSGLSILKKDSQKIYNFDVSNGFSVDGVFQVLVDYTQTVWATSNHGIFNLKLKDIDDVMNGTLKNLTPTYFSKLDGISSGGVTSTSLSMKDDKGRLWFTLIDGFTVFDPVRNANDTIQPTVKIQTAMLDNDKVVLSANQKLIVAPGVKRLNLKYTGISFVSSEQIQFRIKLEGFDKEFSEWTKERTASYTNLKPGTYRFYVMARNADGWTTSKYSENTTTTSISIIKKPYFWQRPWFVGIVVLLVIGFVVLWVYLRLLGYKRKQAQLEKIVQNRTQELTALKDSLEQQVLERTAELKEQKEQVQKLSFEVTSALAQTIDAKDKYTKGHSNRVAKYSKLLASALGESREFQDQIYYVAQLHDIGKIGIPNAIINKPEKLTDEEYEIIKTHPVIGSDILKSISSMPEISIGARSHHERYDGKGYPDGLKGEEIPWIARIIGVADAYDAMTSNRSYRSYMPQDKVKAEIERCRGLQFDPRVADAMIKLIEADVEYTMHE